ncbi:mucin-5AC-like [Mercenaria mercenaria]|uniref:mucin-5AC-like n=1 Tax=Mercenaria mercenaria TaxID=6596 RepID=UPI00234F6886|nr:mucin-5AC-like [Mercenaria mercenaria]
MTFFLKIFILCTLAKIKEIQMITVSNKQVTVTFHDYDRSWNEAEKICENAGGKLYVEDSIERTTVLEKYKTDWNKNEDPWIGLHYPAIGTSDIFAWTNCFWLEYSNYKDDAEPKDTSKKKCIQSDKDGLGWKTHQCDHNHRFVCEKLGDDCLFNRRTGIPTKTVDFTLVTMTTLDKNACESKCLVKIENNRNCWGLNFYSALGSNNCALYFADDPFYFTDSATYDASTTDMSIKTCYSKALDTADDTSVGEDNSATPTEICSPYTDQTTTTTVPTTTSTTTTTEAPTTTTAAHTTTTEAPTTTTAAPTTTTAAPTTTTAAPTTKTAAPTTTTAAPTTTTAAPTTAAPTTTTAAPTTTTAAPTTTTAAPTTTTAASTTTTASPTTAAPTITTAAPTITTAAPTTTTAAPTTTTAAPTTTTAASATTTAATTTTTAAPITSSTATDAITSTSAACTCGCSDLSEFIGGYKSDPAWLNMTTEEKVAYLVVKLQVDKTKLSATIRKKTSAQDNRVVAKSVGYVAIAFICIVFGLMIVSDGIRFFKYITQEKVFSSNSVDHLEEEDSAL